MIDVIKADGVREMEQIASMRSRAAAANQSINEAAGAIMADVQARGYEAVREYSLRFDKAEPREIAPEELQAAYDACPRDLIAAMERSARNIRVNNEHLLSQSKEWRSPDGGTVGRIVRGLTKVGIYVPGGTAAYPSSVLMTAVPAKVAGVKEIIMLTPPTSNLNQAVLAAAKIAGVDRVIGVGGAQAVAAVTYGAGFIPRVDKLVGPGNAFVAAAKRMAYGTLDIDMVAGPSDILVLADATANPTYVAADLIGQAEHDRLASAVLVTTSEELAVQVKAEIQRQAAYLARKEIIEESLNNYGAILVCDTLERAAELANEIAPEHMEICTERPRDILPLIQNAGAVFLGSWTPEPLGDYLAGPDHVLPTSGTARFFSPLSVDSFLKTMSVLDFDRASLEPIHQEITTFAEAEHLTAHANCIKVRFGEV